MSRRQARALLVSALLLLPLLGAELGLRGLVALGRIPEAPAHERPFEVSWLNYHRAWPVDIVILGDSMTEHAIPPVTMDAILGSQLGRRVRSFNLASSGADFKVSLAVVEGLVREDRLPDVVLIGISPTALTGHDTFLTAFAPSPMGSRLAGCSWAKEIEQWLSCQLTQVSELWAWRGEPQRLIEALTHPVPTTLAGPGSPLLSDGYRPGPPANADDMARDLARLEAGGGTAFQLGPSVRSDLTALVGAIRDAGSVPLGFTIPHAPPFVEILERQHPGWGAARRSTVQMLAGRLDMPIADVVDIGAWWDVSDSRDAIHLSRRGAPQFTQQLMADPTFAGELRTAIDASQPAARP